MGKWLGAALAGYAAYSLAIGIGIPAWIDWPTRAVPADATDIGFLVAAAAIWLTSGCNPTQPPQP